MAIGMAGTVLSGSSVANRQEMKTQEKPPVSGGFFGFV
jgi:hypothetical protein